MTICRVTLRNGISSGTPATSATGNVRRKPSKAQKANVSRITSLTEPKTIKQKANRFLRWRKHKMTRL
jgi:hypothetical protein